MRIIHLISGGDVGGAKTHVLTLLRDLSKSHEIRLVCFMAGAFSREAKEMGIATTVMPGGNLPRSCRKLAKLIKNENIQLIHCHGAKGNVAGVLLRGLTGIPVISTVHSDPKLDYMGRALANLTYGSLHRSALKRMDYWVTVSDALREQLIDRGIDGWRTFTIYNGVDFTNLRPLPPKRVFLESLGLDWDDSQVIFGIAARLNPVKDIGTLLKAFGKVAEEKKNVKLLIAGDGEERAHLEAEAAALCPGGSYHFAGWLRDTDSFYDAVDVNMLTSLTEGFPYAIPEGARRKCATIATAVGGVPKMVEDGQTGFLVSPADVDALALRMTQVAEDASLRLRLGQAIFEKVRREFSLEVTVKRQVEIYETVLRREARRHLDRDGVLICGAYGRGNMGDETILGAMVESLRAHDGDLPIWVMSRKPRLTERQNPVSSIPIFAYPRAYRVMRRARLYLSGGGSLIQDATSTRSLLFYLDSIRAAKKRGCEVMMYGCGIGPVTGEKNRRHAARTIDRYVDCIALRDPESRQELERMGVTKPTVHVTADPALLQDVSPEKLLLYRQYARQAGLREDGAYCLFALRPWGDFRKRLEVVAKAAEYAYTHFGLTPVLFQMEPDKDGEITQAVASMLSCPKVVLPVLTDGAMICALMRQMRLVVSMRLHALIFAAGQGTAVVGISYDPKVQGFMDYMGKDHYVPLESLTEQALTERVDAALRDAGDMESTMERLRSLASENDRLAWVLYQGEGET